jgi:hypothetical protein
MTDPNLYRDSAARFDTVVGNNEYFILLRKMRDEYNNFNIPPTPFEEYVLEKYGVQIMFDTISDTISPNYKIIDEEKYLLARIKFA